MSEQGQTDLWAELRRHPAFQAAVVFAGASWLTLQAADIFGLPTGTVRLLGALLVVVFVVLVGVSFAAVLRRGGGTALPVRRLRTRTVALSTVTLLVLGTGAWLARPYIVPPIRAGADVIAVLPFSATGPSVELLGEGLVDLLSANLNEVGEIRAINPRTTLHEFERQSRDGSIDLDGQLRVGRNVGAGSVVVGSVVSTGSEVRIRAELYSVETGSIIAKAQKSGAPDAMLALVDQLSVELMQDIWRSRAPLPELRVSAITTQSVPAIRAYLRGEKFYRGVQWDSAAAAFEEAIAHDSTFALAHFRLGETYGWRESLGSAKATEHSELAARLADRLPARERALVVAHQLHEQGRVDAMDSLRSYINRFPDDITGHYMLADARYHAAPLLSTPHEELLTAFERVIERDSTFAPAYAHLIDLTALLDDSARYTRYMASYAALAPEESQSYGVIGGVRWGAREDVLRNLGVAARAGSSRPQNVARIMNAAAARSFGDEGDVDLLLAAIDTIANVFSDNPQITQVAQQQRIGVLGSAGRIRDVERAVAPLRERAGPGQTLDAVLPLIIGGAPDSGNLRPERETLRRAEQNPVAAYWLAIGAMMAGDVPTVERHLATIRGDTARRGFLRAEHIAALNGWLTAARGDTMAGITQIQRALTQLGYAPMALGPSGPLRAQLGMLQAAQPTTRAEGIRRLETMARQEYGMAPFILVTLGEAYEAEGRIDDARAAYARFVSLWRNADAELLPRRQTAERALQRLSGDRGST